MLACGLSKSHDEETRVRFIVFVLDLCFIIFWSFHITLVLRTHISQQITLTITLNLTIVVFVSQLLLVFFPLPFLGVIMTDLESPRL